MHLSSVPRWRRGFANFWSSYVISASNVISSSKPTLHATRMRSLQPIFYSISRYVHFEAPISLTILFSWVHACILGAQGSIGPLKHVTAYKTSLILVILTLRILQDDGDEA